jgi:hypothetical protein
MHLNCTDTTRRSGFAPNWQIPRSRHKAPTKLSLKIHSSLQCYLLTVGSSCCCRAAPQRERRIRGVW